MPMAFWLTLLFGKTAKGGADFLSLPLFEGVKEILLYIKKEAENATDGASVLLLVTTLYSATNLFYQMRRTGEIVYDYHIKAHGVKMRLVALGLLFLTMLAAAIMIAFLAMLSFLLSKVVSQSFGVALDCILLYGGAFSLVLLLNVYVCPYKVRVTAFLPGSLLTVCAWGVAIALFAVYLRVGNVTRLYGALSALVVFLLWLYVLMIGFVVGVVMNSKQIVKIKTAE